MSEGSGPVLLPTAYFPPISYMALLFRGEAVFIEAEETFPKQTYRNRCVISTVNGKLDLVVPVTRSFGNHTTTSQVEISFAEPWNKRHWRAIVTAYSSSPFFLYYCDELKPLFKKIDGKLLQHNNRILETLLQIIGFTVDIHLTSTYMREPDDISDLRALIHPKKPALIHEFPNYQQVFKHKQGFIPDLSILDLIFNLGPESKEYLWTLRMND